MIQKTILLVLCIIGSVFVMPNTDAVSFDNPECVEILISAELDLTDTQMYGACNDIAINGEAIIEDFRDRGLLIKFITLGETVSIPLL